MSLRLFLTLRQCSSYRVIFDLVGEDVLVSGAGPIGIMAAAVCKHVGARHVVIADVNEYRLDLARKMA